MFLMGYTSFLSISLYFAYLGEISRDRWKFADIEEDAGVRAIIGGRTEKKKYNQCIVSLMWISGEVEQRLGQCAHARQLGLFS